MLGWIRDEKVRNTILWSLWGLYFVAWSTALLTPHPVWIAQAVLPPASQFPTAKSLHVAAYLVWTVLTLCLPASRPLRWGLLALLSAHAMATEYLQHEYLQQMVPPRSGSWRDVGLDHIGIVLGLAFFGLWCWHVSRPARSASEGRRR